MSEETYYQVWCEDEQKYFGVWSSKSPSECPNNFRHTINQSITIPGAKRLNDVPIVKILEENIPTNGCFRHESFKFHIGSNGIYDNDIIFPYNISILGVGAHTTAEHTGDKVNVTSIPVNNIIGSTTSNLNIGESNIKVTPSVLTYIHTGSHCMLSNSTSQYNMGEVISINPETKTIITEYASSNIYTANTNVCFSEKMIKNLYFTVPHNYNIGQKKLGASHIPAKTSLRISYSNSSSNQEKDFIVNIEYLY